MSNYYQTNAITLARRDARENDRVYSFYTEHLGKILVQATSARKIKSRLSGHLEPFGIVEIGIVRGFRKNRLASARTQDRYENIYQDIEKIFCAGYLLRLIDELVKEGMPDGKVYHLLRSGIMALNEKKIDGCLKIFNAVFTLKLLSLLGYQPKVRDCVVCTKNLSEENNVFSIRRGGIICARCKKESEEDMSVSQDDIKFLCLSLDLDIVDILAMPPNPQVFKKFNVIVAEFLKYHLR